MSKPADSRSSSTLWATACSGPDPFPTPAQRIRALLSEGKAPKPEVETSNGSWLPPSCSRACSTRIRSSSATLPRNFKVRWSFSGRMRRKALLAGRSRAARNSASLTSGGGKTATKVRTAVLTGAGLAAGGAVGDQGRGGSCADAVIHVDHAETGGAGLEHAEDGCGPVPAEAVPGGGGKPYHRHGDEAGDHAWQRTFHPGGNHQAVGVERSQLLQRAGEAMDAGHPDVVEAHHGHTHLAGHRERLL